ncbi:MAG: hypothetical protein LBS52_05945 [Dysgonamonadaceae bacterium]|jgi:hypothetical protein|nr:hypothetical protein [Dysgonamonadaceae bacterium]
MRFLRIYIIAFVFSLIASANKSIASDNHYIEIIYIVRKGIAPDVSDGENSVKAANINPYFNAVYETSQAYSQTIGLQLSASILGCSEQVKVIEANLLFHLQKLGVQKEEILKVPCSGEIFGGTINEYKKALYLLRSVSADDYTVKSPLIDSLLPLCRFNWDVKGVNASIGMVEEEIRRK